MVRILIIFLLISAIAEGQRKFYGSIQTVSGSVIVDDTLKVDVITPDDSSAVKVSSNLIVKDSLRADLIGVDDSVRVTVLNNLRGNANITVKDTLKADIITADDSSRATIKNGLIISGNGSEISRFGFSFTPTLQPNFDIKDNAGTTVLNVDSVGRILWNNNSSIASSGTNNLLINVDNRILLSSGNTIRAEVSSTGIIPNPTNSRSLGTSAAYWENVFLNVLQFQENAPRSIVHRTTTTANTAGANFSISGSGATSGATDKNGGMVTIATGLSTGTAFASLRLQVTSRAFTTATTYNTLQDRFIITSPKTIADNTATTLFNVAVAEGQTAGITIEYTISTTGGAGNESHTETGKVYYQVANDGAVTVNVDKTSSTQLKTDAGNYTVTFSATEANPSVISVTADSELDVNSIIHYSIINSNGRVITQL